MTANDPRPQMSARGDDPGRGGPAPGGPEAGRGPDPAARPEAGERPPADPLDALRERIRRTQDAVERLADEAAQAAPDPADPRRTPGGDRAAGGRPPPNGYATQESSDGDRTGAREAEAVVALFDLVRGLVPRELQHQLTELVRELLLLLRALIDWYLERLDARRKRPVEVEDIPIS